MKILNTMCFNFKHTYKSRGAETQVDYILLRQSEGKTMKDCTVIPEEACLTQHRLLCGDIMIKGMARHRRGRVEKKIKQMETQG